MNRQEYVKHCRTSVGEFLQQSPRTWVRYVRGTPPPNLSSLLLLRRLVKGMANNGLVVRTDHKPDRQAVVDLKTVTFNLVDKVLAEYRRPKGVVVATEMGGELIMAYSLCHGGMKGDVWNRHVALWKAIERLQNRKTCLGPCWLDQFPPTVQSTALVLAEELAQRVRKGPEPQWCRPR